ncbi:pyrimidine 5'-nucleotidase [Primorskyibacter sp. S187A]|uniref:pyrimidine 5'-nucleotidase n=1 Tax=Primorskyibacter sp. S187A TaxID=3415130 RepID=UPI003C7B03F7
MAKQHFSHVDTWVFDLDNTLYDPATRLFDQIEPRMTDWVMRVTGATRAEADVLRRTYWREHGTTLAGLMREHGVDPHEYLHDVHQIDFSVLSVDPELRHHITALPGRKIVYTNGSAPYAENVLAARGLSNLFDAIYGVEHAGFHPKPDAAAFEAVFARDGVAPERGAMFEDDPRNLKVPHDLGMATILVAPKPEPAPHIHHHTSNLSQFLGTIIAPATA